MDIFTLFKEFLNEFGANIFIEYSTDNIVRREL